MPGDQVRITGRQAQGVTLFRLGDGERVASVFPVIEETASDDGTADEGASDDGAPDDDGPPQPEDGR